MMVDRAFKIRASEKKIHLNSNIQSHVKHKKKRSCQVSDTLMEGGKDTYFVTFR